MRETLASAVPACLLAVVAIHQIVLAHTTLLDPWKGGGFGMFSSDAGTTSRHIHAYVVNPSGESEIEIPDALDEEEYRLLVEPTRARFADFARRLSEAIADEHVDHRTLRVEIFAIGYDPIDLVPRTTRIHSHRHEAAP